MKARYVDSYSPAELAGTVDQQELFAEAAAIYVHPPHHRTNAPTARSAGRVVGGRTHSRFTRSKLSHCALCLTPSQEVCYPEAPERRTAAAIKFPFRIAQLQLVQMKERAHRFEKLSGELCGQHTS